MNSDVKFGFGLEAEYLLLDNAFSPLWIDSLNAEQLFDIVHTISNADFSIDGFNVKPLHKTPGHYIVEGYLITDEQYKDPVQMLPKGLEIRTPIAATVEQSLADLNLLRKRLDARLAKEGMKTAVLSHHPLKLELDAPRNYARYDFWQWSLTAASTYGPDFNISVPAEIMGTIDRKRLHDRLNYYMPALIGLSLYSPLVKGQLWKVDGQVGKSIRTYRRRVYAPLYYIHEHIGTWFEFKGFEMAQREEDYCGYFLLCLALLLGDGLDEIDTDENRIAAMGEVAVDGLKSHALRDRAKRVFEQTEKMAIKYGFDKKWLDPLAARLENGMSPADDLIEIFQQAGSIEETFKILHEGQSQSRPVVQSFQPPVSNVGGEVSAAVAAAGALAASAYAGYASPSFS